MYNCKAVDSLRVFLSCTDGDVFIPNAFTPDANGKNDEFRIHSEVLKDLTLLRIFNRWGQLVFETNDMDKGWDGTYNGKPLMPGVFVFYLDAVCLNGTEIHITG